MRRICAILLLALLSFPLLSPALLASDAETKLPACCRRSGIHRCSILARDQQANGPALQTASCPSFPAAIAFLGNRNASSLGIAPPLVCSFTSHPAARPQAEALCRISYSRAGQKRGPPTVIS